MKRIGEELIRQAVASIPNCRRGPREDLSKETIAGLKWKFLKTARSLEPRFEVVGQNRAVINDIFNWCVQSDGRYDPGKGLWIWGDIGTGKSTMLRIVKEFCKEVRPRSYLEGWGYVPYSFSIVDARDVAGEYVARGLEGLSDYVKSQRIAFDELGAESVANRYGTALNVFEYILQRRYDNRHNSFTHVTTNFSIEQLRDVYGDRVYDRCKEMFNFVEMAGASWR